MPPTEATETIRVAPSSLQRPDVGAVVDLVRRDRVAVAVAREEHHLARRAMRPKVSGPEGSP